MQLKQFRIQMYRCITDSGWVDVDNLTVLVGKNEVGKTSLLRALHKLNPYQKDPYIMDSEWPRGRRQEREDSQKVCTARFQLDKDEITEIFDLAKVSIDGGIIEVSRDYGGQLEVNVEQLVFPEKLGQADLERLAGLLPPVSETVGAPFKEKAVLLTRLMRDAIIGDVLVDLSKQGEMQIKSLQRVMSNPNNQPSNQNEQQFINTYAGAVTQISEEIEKARPLRKFLSWVWKRLPTFIYMSDYRAFTGSAQLDQILERQGRKQLTEEDKTLLMILKLSGLDLAKEVEKGNSANREQRQYDLDDASETITRTISDRWRQRKYEVEFRADGQLFYTFVKDQKDPSLIKLEERSQGFQWFFSFDLLFMYESQGTFKGCVILLDEPGLHLHPEAQRDLLSRLEAYAADNTLLYTTHLPFLIDLRKPEKIRVLNETENGTVVTSDLTKSQPEAKFVLQAALGISGSSSYLLSQRNLVVEGVDDFWIISELSNLMKRSGRQGLREDLFITPSGGASEAAYIATFMIGQKLDVVVLLDSDKAGDAARDALVKRWLTRYNSSTARVISLGPLLGVTDRAFSIEDLFGDAYYLSKVEQCYDRELKAAGIQRIELIGTGSLPSRVESAFQGYGIRFNKGSVAKLIHKDLQGWKSTSHLPPGVEARALKLVEEISTLLSEK